MIRLLCLLLLIVVASCKNETVGPTGGFKITYVYNLSTNAGGPYYNLYTELSYARGDVLQAGTMSPISKNTYQVTLTDLNPGNYIIVASVGTDRSERVVQVTAGQQREYTF